MGSARQVSFTIVGAKALSNANTAISPIPSQTYTGNAITPADFTVAHKDDGVLIAGTDYDDAYGANVAAGSGSVAVNGKGKYSGSVSASFSISRKSLESAMFLAISPQKYEGSPLEPLLDGHFNGKALTLGTDYTVTYSNNNGASNEGGSAIAAGTGNFSGIAILSFAITEDGEGGESEDVEVIWGGALEFTYNGYPQKPSATAYTKNGLPLAIKVEGEQMGARSDPYIATAALAKHSAAYNLTNKTQPFKISKAGINPVLNIPSVPHGATLTPAVSGNLGGGAVQYHYAPYATAGEGLSGYSLTVPSASGAYMCKAVVLESPNYLGGSTSAVPFNITAPDAEPLNIVWSGPTSFVYNGIEQRPSATATHKGESYALTVTGAVNAGTHAAFARLTTPNAAFQLVGNEKAFEISPKPLASNSVSPIGGFFYVGGQIIPEVEVIDREIGDTLVKGRDYEVSYGDNVNVGEGAATVTGKGNYSGELVQKFSISSPGASIADVEWGDLSVWEYDGSLHAPAVISSGGHTVTVEGAESNAGNYVATARLAVENPNVILKNFVKPFTIAPQKLTVSWSEPKTFAYNKMVQSPKPSVAGNEVALTVLNGQVEAGVYNSENGLNALVIITDEAKRNNYVLLNNAADYEITKKTLDVELDPSKSESAVLLHDTVYVSGGEWRSEANLMALLDSLISYKGFAVDTASKAADDETVLSGSPQIELGSAEETPKAKVYKPTVSTSEMSAKNYVPIAKSYVVAVNKEGTPVRPSYASPAVNGEGTLYYDLKGNLIGTKKPAKAGAYVEKRGKAVRMAVVK